MTNQLWCELEDMRCEKDQLIKENTDAEFVTVGDCTFHNAEFLFANIQNNQVVLQCAG